MRKGEFSPEERKGVFKPDEVYEVVKDVLFNRLKTKVMFHGEQIKGNSKRYQVFFTKGMKCVACGVEGKFFAMEKNQNDVSYHLNLYGIKDGKEILMTKDHIIPRSKGGSNDISNLQCMCVYCNKKKGNHYE